MNKNTGEIKEFSVKEINELSSDWIQVEEKDMTEKQKLTKKVSLHDNKSNLGKKLIVHRCEPCPCGSGKKFKFCCRNK